MATPKEMARKLDHAFKKMQFKAPQWTQQSGTATMVDNTVELMNEADAVILAQRKIANARHEAMLMAGIPQHVRSWFDERTITVTSRGLGGMPVESLAAEPVDGKLGDVCWAMTKDEQEQRRALVVAGLNKQANLVTQNAIDRGLSDAGYNLIDPAGMAEILGYGAIQQDTMGFNSRRSFVCEKGTLCIDAPDELLQPMPIGVIKEYTKVKARGIFERFSVCAPSELFQAAPAKSVDPLLLGVRPSPSGDRYYLLAKW